MLGGMKIVCGEPWTVDGRWVVVGPYYEGADRDSILFDPPIDQRQYTLAAIAMCTQFIREALTAAYETV